MASEYFGVETVDVPHLESDESRDLRNDVDNAFTRIESLKGLRGSSKNATDATVHSIDLTIGDIQRNETYVILPHDSVDDFVANLPDLAENQDGFDITIVLADESANPATVHTVTPDANYILAPGTSLAMIWDGTNWIRHIDSQFIDQVVVSLNDTTPEPLATKLVAGANITLTEQNDGGNEKLEISATGGVSSDELVKADATDSTAGYLEDKMVGGSGIEVIKKDDGGVKSLEIKLRADSASESVGAGGVVLTEEQCTENSDIAVSSTVATPVKLESGVGPWDLTDNTELTVETDEVKSTVDMATASTPLPDPANASSGDVVAALNSEFSANFTATNDDPEAGAFSIVPVSGSAAWIGVVSSPNPSEAPGDADVQVQLSTPDPVRVTLADVGVSGEQLILVCAPDSLAPVDVLQPDGTTLLTTLPPGAGSSLTFNSTSSEWEEVNISPDEKVRVSMDDQAPDYLADKVISENPDVPVGLKMQGENRLLKLGKRKSVNLEAPLATPISQAQVRAFSNIYVKSTAGSSPVMSPYVLGSNQAPFNFAPGDRLDIIIGDPFGHTYIENIGDWDMLPPDASALAVVNHINAYMGTFMMVVTPDGDNPDKVRLELEAESEGFIQVLDTSVNVHTILGFSTDMRWSELLGEPPILFSGAAETYDLMELADLDIEFEGQPINVIFASASGGELAFKEADNAENYVFSAPSTFNIGSHLGAVEVTVPDSTYTAAQLAAVFDPEVSTIGIVATIDSGGTKLRLETEDHASWAYISYDGLPSGEDPIWDSNPFDVYGTDGSGGVQDINAVTAQEVATRVIEESQAAGTFVYAYAIPYTAGVKVMLAGDPTSPGRVGEQLQITGGSANAAIQFSTDPVTGSPGAEPPIVAVPDMTANDDGLRVTIVNPHDSTAQWSISATGVFGGTAEPGFGRSLCWNGNLLKWFDV